MTLQHKMITENNVIIVGAGSSGLSLAYYLLKQGVRPLILDAAPSVASSWRKRHPQLALNTHRLLSALPGMAIPKSKGTFVSRDDYIEYLERYEQMLKKEFNLSIQFGQEVYEIMRVRNSWVVDSPKARYVASHVVIATGPDRKAFVPTWKGVDSYLGNVIHAADFGQVGQYDGKHVLIVGGANSGIDVANHLVRRCRHASLTISMRHGTHLMPTYIGGIPAQITGPFMAKLPVFLQDLSVRIMARLCFGNLQKYGVKTPVPGVASRLIESGIAPGFDAGFVTALKKGQLAVVSEIKELSGTEVFFKNGEQGRFDHIICATGYHTGLESILPKECIEENHRYSDAAGLVIFGMVPLIQGSLYARRKEAKILAKGLVDSLRCDERFVTRLQEA